MQMRSALHIALIHIPSLLLFSPPSGLHWHMLFYLDGLTPGNIIAPENNRKSTVFYISFMEFGGKLFDTEAWLPIAVARTACCSTIV